MGQETVTFRLDAERKKALDAIASGLDRDRTYVINEAIRSYLEIYEWQIGHIKEGLRQAQKGEFASPTEVSAAFAKWRKHKSA